MTTQIILPRTQKPFFGLKYVNSMMRIRDGKNSDPGWKKVGSGIRKKHPGTATLVDSLYFGLHVVMISCLFLSSSHLSGGSFPLLIPSCGSLLHLKCLTWLWSPIIPFKGSFSTIVPLSGSSSLPIPLRVSISSLFLGYSLDILCCCRFPNLSLLVSLFLL